MRELAELLENPSSTLPLFVRAAAIGFRSQLDYLRENIHTADPGHTELRKLLAALDEALNRSSSELRELSNGGSETAPAAIPTTALGNLASRWAATNEGKILLPPSGKELTSADLYLLTWRLPPAAAKTWRAEWRREYSNSNDEEQVAGPLDEPLIPGVACLSTSARLPSDFSPGGPLTGRLARVVAAVTWFAEYDPSLRFCLQSAYRFGFAPMQEIHKQRYTIAAKDRLGRFAEAEQSGSVEEMLRAFVAVDEVVHSLVHQPLAHPQSAYAMLGQACRGLLSEVRTLAEQAGLKPHVQVIAGNFADCLRLTEKNDIEGQGSGAPGDVIHCCRIFLSLSGDISPGRVIYKSR